MAISFSLVDGPAFAEPAAMVLGDAWEPPALSYTPAYLTWQLGFPSSAKMPSAAAFDGSEPVGFSGATARTLRCGSVIMDAAVVSFVAVRPRWRGQGIAAGLYRTLLGALAQGGVPVITFAIVGSAGERAILRAYTDAGFGIKPLGTYSNFAFSDRRTGASNGWSAGYSLDSAALASRAVRRSSVGELVLWSMPGEHQMAHYFADPRPRKLLTAEHTSTGAQAAALVVRSEMRTLRDIECVTTLDCLWAAGADTGGLLALLRLASAAWHSPNGSAPVVTCPNLTGFDPSELRAIGVRRTGAQFRGYFCTPGETSWPPFERTNLEVV